MLKYIRLHLTAQRLGEGDRRLSARVIVGSTDMPTAAGEHDVARLLIHALSKGTGGELHTGGSAGFPYEFPVVF